MNQKITELKNTIDQNYSEIWSLRDKIIDLQVKPNSEPFLEGLEARLKKVADFLEPELQRLERIKAKAGGWNAGL